MTAKFYIGIALILFLFAGVYSATAQIDSISFYKKYELETIYLSGKGYIKNGQKFKLKNLSNEFDSSKLGLAIYQGYKTDQTKFIVTYSIGLGLLIGGIASHQSNQQVSNVLLLSGMGGVVFSLHFAIRSQNKLSKAIWIRNRDVLMKP